MMAKRGCVWAVATFLMLSAATAFAADEPGGEVSELVVLTATVDKIDMATREVTLRSEDGKLETVRVGPEARNLDQVRAGDKVTMKYYRALAIFVGPAGEEPSITEMTEVRRAPPGAKPAGQVTSVVEAVATVEALDPAERTATIRGPRGNVQTLKVDGQVRLDKVKVGDRVVVRYTEAIAISVETVEEQR